ncbi:c2H2-type domain-containing protein [Trichonephila inaurata madagascariensis]|uniref:C2H2-type domain-containing protein n=1 Tax=Trichonephila inaurata madagascariensis TaxID=2747483 RepID=A0A8X7BPT5_9ARAC|nr:c2H2-type domain-containing protein [Trichonephila inaurata madagascariensis]
MSSANSLERPFSAPNKPTFSCQKCGITVGYKKNLYAHMRKFHPEEDVVISNNQVCGLCKETFRTIVNLHEHLHQKHDVELNFSNETFYSEEDFFKWKKKIELESGSSFFLRNTSEKCEVKFSYYVCNRSGYSNPKLNRTRQMKASGSVRCGCTCPAVLNVSTYTVEEAKEITVQYQSVHVGHDLEVRKRNPLRRRTSCRPPKLAPKNAIGDRAHNAATPKVILHTGDATLVQASMDSEMNATITECKDLERCIKQLKSIDQVRYAKETIAALKIHLNSMDNATNLPSLPPV